MSEYRQDDRTLGYCPKCGAVLSTVFVDAAGWCPDHGRVWAEWNEPRKHRAWCASLSWFGETIGPCDCEPLAVPPEVSDRDHGDETERIEP